MLRGNRGEWSEVYVFFKLMGDGKLYAADSDLEKMEFFYKILSITRIEDKKEIEYHLKKDIVKAKQNSKIIAEKPADYFAKKAGFLFQKIKNYSGDTGSFGVPEVEKFLREIGSSKLKAGSRDKRDITIKVHDPETGLEPQLGFSIKSKLGSSSTLLNPSRATNFLFKISDNILLEKRNEINEANRIRDIIKEIENTGAKLEFHNIESLNFYQNLSLIDSRLPEIVAHLLLLHYKGEMPSLKEGVKKLKKNDPLDFKDKQRPFYEYKVKAFLRDVALGLRPNGVWEGSYDASGGYIVVRKDGEVLCYHIININKFLDYLLDNTKFDSPSRSRYNFGKVYEEEGNCFLKLNLQIRFK